MESSSESLVCRLVCSALAALLVGEGSVVVGRAEQGVVELKRKAFGGLLDWAGMVVERWRADGFASIPRRALVRA